MPLQGPFAMVRQLLWPLLNLLLAAGSFLAQRGTKNNTARALVEGGAAPGQQLSLSYPFLDKIKILLKLFISPLK